jgi:hypothetical protein
MPSDGIGVSSAVAWPPAEPYREPAEDGKPHIWAQKGFQFHDLLDIVNPLQHLPIVGPVYRWITGDTIGNLPRIAGDALYGGLIGLASGLVNVLVKEETGKDIGETVLALVTGGDDKPVPSAAAAQPAPTTPAIADIAPTAAPPPQQPAPPARADRPAIPLVRGIGMSVAPPSTQESAAQTFLAQQAERRRQLYGTGTGTAPQAASGRTLTAQPVPLSIPPGSLMPQPRLTPISAGAGGSVGSAPVDISQKMLDALDKYAALQRQREGTSLGRGTQVDVAP